MKGKSEKTKRFSIVPTIFFIVVAVFYLAYDKYSFSKQNAAEPFVSVVSVADGDTVTVLIDRKEQKVRLIGIDAPELGQEPWGPKSKKYMEDLLQASGWKVGLEYDVERRDKFGRTLAYLRTTDGRIINLLMVEGGYAMLFTVAPNVGYVNELTAAQTEARNKKLGVWSEKGLTEKPADYRREHPRK
jgi:micrococcal nuclease